LNSVGSHYRFKELEYPIGVFVASKKGENTKLVVDDD